MSQQLLGHNMLPRGQGSVELVGRWGSYPLGSDRKVPGRCVCWGWGCGFPS